MDETREQAVPAKRRWGRAAVWARRILLGLFCIFLFVLALFLMKEGAEPLAPLIRGKFSVDSPASALGFGWLSANLALSGSPVAATALALLDAQVLSPVETFAMIAGSRLGAAFVVLLIGFMYLLRGKQRDLSLSVGLLSLLVTQTLYPAVLLLGFGALSSPRFQTWQVDAQREMQSPFALFFNPLLDWLQGWLPAWTLFVLGFLLVLLSLWLFDRVIPDLHLEETKLHYINRILYRPVVTFALGALVTMLTMSVSVSLSLLVPLSVRGVIRRENVIPYILGANITTFVDTLVAAALLVNPAAITVVFVQMGSVLVVSLLILLTSFRFYQRTLEYLVGFLGRKRRHLIIYVFVIFLVPFILLIYG